jgi:cell division protein ZapA
VVTSANDDELTRLAQIVDAKLSEVVPAGRAVTPQAMLLAAMALAHELEEERARSTALASNARDIYGRLIARVDAVLGDPTLGDPTLGDAPRGGPTLAMLGDDDEAGATADRANERRARERGSDRSELSWTAGGPPANES